MIETFQLKNETEKCILVETIHYESICAEFDPGPDQDDPFPEYHNTEVSVKLVNLDKNTITDMSSVDMKKFYPQITGRNTRISYFYLMKYRVHQETFNSWLNNIRFMRNL